MTQVVDTTKPDELNHVNAVSDGNDLFAQMLKNANDGLQALAVQSEVQAQSEINPARIPVSPKVEQTDVFDQAQVDGHRVDLEKIEQVLSTIGQIGLGPKSDIFELKKDLPLGTQQPSTEKPVAQPAYPDQHLQNVLSSFGKLFQRPDGGLANELLNRKKLHHA